MRVDIKRTGNVRFRRGWFGKLILQVEESWEYYDDCATSTSPRCTGWRDADVHDVSHVVVSRADDGRLQ